MLLNYDFLEFENDKKVRVIDDKLCVNILDFFGIGDEDDKIFLGDEISNIKNNPTEAYAAEVYAIEGAKLNRVYEKIRSGLPFGIISAFRPFKGVFTKDFTDEEQKALIKAAKSDSLTRDFLRENDGIYRKLFDQEAICYCKNAIHDKENTYKVELVSTLSGDFNEVWAEFSDITFSVPSQLPQSLTRLKNKAATFFSKQPGGNCSSMSFKEIDKVQIKATCMPNIVTGVFEDDIKLSIQHSQWCGYPKVFDIEKIESIEREVIEKREQHKIGSAQNLKINQIADDLKQGEVVSNKLIANALITQKAPSDTPHDDDLD
ncbi:hypothetical protein I6764_04415 [Helicobacter pylori]|uniref:hypothetical protein n=1 Tax=Helicobacter pylori TaxID=210 RepID=UPI0018D0AB99|nr:hypothetical protein [Helicobacter pylori]MBH0273629.1 hypothetical protein [Helicobacter pylori]